MSSGDTPAVARRKVRLAIKEARTAKGDTQSQVADAMEWSLSKVMRIESGEVTIAQNDLRPLLSYLGVKDRKVVEDLVTAAKASKQRRQWWDDKRYGSMLTHAMRQLFGFEAEASTLRYYSPVAVPGPLQTPGYARGIMSQFTHELSDGEIEARVEVRERRKQLLRQRDPRPEIFVLFDESVLLRRIGGHTAFTEQVAELSRFISEGWLTARIHPLDNPYPGLGPFEMFHLEAGNDAQTVLYRESLTADEIIDDPVRIERHHELWDRMWKSSIDEKESARRIAALAADTPDLSDSGKRPADHDSSG
jgi:transcriptional regulator with XRE-family HTH domain